MKTEMTFEEMTRCLEVWDQTVGCANCGKAYWGENCPENFYDFHAEGCPIRGREDVHQAAEFNSED